MLKANDKRLVAVLVKLDGHFDDGTVSQYRHRFIGPGSDAQILRFKDDVSVGETCLLFELYNRDASSVYKCGCLARKFLAAALGYLGFRDILVSVIITGDPDRFPVHGAFQPAKSLPEALGLFRKARFTDVSE